MPSYTVKDPRSNKTVTLTGDSPPTETELQQIFAKVNGSDQRVPGHPELSMDEWRRRGLPPEGIQYTNEGALTDEAWNRKTPQEKLQNLLQFAGNVTLGMIGGSEGVRAAQHPALTLAGAAVPLAVRGAGALIPSKERAGQAFQDVMAAAGDKPVDISAAGNQALKTATLAEHGGTMPRPVMQFLRRVTDPTKPEMNYEEARQWASNISRLSANEFNRLTPAMQREVGSLRVALNDAIEKTAEAAGKGDQYRGAMSEYARRAQLDKAFSEFWSGAKKTIPWASGAGLGYYGAQKLQDVIGGK